MCVESVLMRGIQINNNKSGSILMQTNYEKKISDLESEISQRRNDWRKLREKRLELRDNLLFSGFTKQAVRKHKEYKRLKKEQHYCSVSLRHLEKRLFKMNLLQSNPGHEKK